MALFFVLACLLVAIALIAILPSALALRGNSSADTQQELDQLETNITIAKERRATLQNAHATGTIDDAVYATEMADLENALAMDLAAKQKGEASGRSSVVIAILIALFLPIASGALYLNLGTPSGIDTASMHEQALAAQQQTQENTAPPALTDLLPNLEKKLEANPEDRDGWKLLGKSYLTIGEFANAKRALLNAYELNKEDPDLLAQLAEATAMENTGALSGKPSEYLDEALAIDAQHQPTLWLKAIASKQAGNHEDAIQRFNALRSMVTNNESALASIDEMVSQSKLALGQSTASGAGTVNNETNTTPAVSTESESASEDKNKTLASLSVTVNLDDSIGNQVEPGDSVFIFARASNGPPMPLAVVRHTVSELPISVVLDDTMAMIPNMTLSQFETVTVGARVSKSGNAIAQAGDWFTEKTNVNVKTVGELTLTINQQK